MPINTNTILLFLILIVVFGGIIFIAFYSDFFNPTIIKFPPGLTPKDFDKPQDDTSCTLSFNKTTACIGEYIRGDLQDGTTKSFLIDYNYED